MWTNLVILMQNWRDKAVSLLRDSLYPVPQELNAIDWKSSLSDKSDRLAQHVCAFANTTGGGYLAFGVNDDATFTPLAKDEIEAVVTKLGNIAKNNLAWSIQIEHAVVDFEGHAVLFVHIPEQTNKPIYLRGKDIYESYIRSAGHTVKMSREQVHEMLAKAHDISFESRVAKSGLTVEGVELLLDIDKLFELLRKSIPTDLSAKLAAMENYELIASHDDSYDILNLGAVLFARRLSDFPTLVGKEIIVRRYQGTNNRILNIEYKTPSGYTVCFEDLISFVMNNTSTEAIGVRREAIPTYPEVAIRELAANMEVHQDFAVTGMPLTIEIFENRLTFTNPGTSLNDINRLIDLPPHSRNEELAQMMLLLRMCERRGSGVDRAVEAIEQMALPAYKVQSGDDYTRITLFPKKGINDMTREERIAACYQHCCLMYEDGQAINNQSIRERFQLNKNQTAMASRILGDTEESGLIKLQHPETGSRKFASYIPYYG